MSAPVPFQVNPDLLRGLESTWNRLVDSLDNLDPGRAVASGADCVGGSDRRPGVPVLREETDDVVVTRITPRE